MQRGRSRSASGSSPSSAVGWAPSLTARGLEYADQTRTSTRTSKSSSGSKMKTQPRVSTLADAIATRQPAGNHERYSDARTVNRRRNFGTREGVPPEVDAECGDDSVPALRRRAVEDGVQLIARMKPDRHDGTPSWRIPRSADEATMIWSVQFYNERRALLARYRVEAALPPEAVVLGRRALLAEYPRADAPAALTSLYQRAQLDRDDGGWVLYRIASVAESGQPFSGRGGQAPDA
jgi:hypothetical protein